MELEIQSLEETAKRLLQSGLTENQRTLVLKLMSDSFEYLNRTQMSSEFITQTHHSICASAPTQHGDSAAPSVIVLH